MNVDGILLQGTLLSQLKESFPSVDRTEREKILARCGMKRQAVPGARTYIRLFFRH